MKNLPIPFYLFCFSFCGPQGPIDIVAGSEKCAFCSMKINDPKFHSQILTSKGRHVHFDSIECMSGWARRNADPSAKRWVRAYDAAVWLETYRATIIQTTNIHSPMGLGLAAFSTESEARKFLSKNPGEVLTSRDLDDIITNFSVDRQKKIP